MSVIFTSDSKQKLVCKGAPEEIFKRVKNCDERAKELYEKWSIEGFRILAVAYKNLNGIGVIFLL